MSRKKNSEKSEELVLITGAGPTGLVAAHELVRHGVPCRIIDKAAHPSLQSKALIIQIRSLEIFSMMGVVEPMLRRGQTIDTLNFYIGGERRAQLRFTEIDSPFPLPLMLEQSATEEVLITSLKEKGIEVERKTELVDFEQDDEGVHVEIRHEDGKIEKINGAFLLGCDGAHSLVRHILDLPFPGSPYPEDFLLGDVLLDWELSSDEVHLFIKSNGLLGVIPMKGERRVRLLGVRKDKPSLGRNAAVSFEEIEELVKEFSPVPAKIRDPVWLANFHLHRRSVSQYRVGRVFLAGDAAHIHSPVGGQGMNTGIQDGFNLAWKIAGVIRGWAKPEILDTYHSERHPVAERVLHTTDRAFAAMVSSNPILNFARNRILPVLAPMVADLAGKEVTEFMSEIKVRYLRSPLSTDQPGAQGKFLDGGPRAGERAPDGELWMEGRPIRFYSLWKEPLHQLLIFPKSADDLIDGKLWEEWQSEIGGDWIRIWELSSVSPKEGETKKIRPLEDPDGKFRKKYGADEGAIYLIRPDGYVAFRSQNLNPQDLTQYLQQFYRVSSLKRKVSHG